MGHKSRNTCLLEAAKVKEANSICLETPEEANPTNTFSPIIWIPDFQSLELNRMDLYCFKPSGNLS